MIDCLIFSNNLKCNFYGKTEVYDIGKLVEDIVIVVVMSMKKYN